jgi:hypothetical protein
VQERLCEEDIMMMKIQLDKCDRECDHFEGTDFVPTRLLDLELIIHLPATVFGLLKR